MTRGSPQFWPDLTRFGAVYLAVSGHHANLHVVIFTITSAIFALYVVFVLIWPHLSAIVPYTPARSEVDDDDDEPK